MKRQAFAVLLFLFAAGHTLAAEIVRDIPKDKWVQIYFETIDRIAANAGLQSLRAARSAETSHIELRLWVGFGLTGTKAFVVQREAGKWSGREIQEDPFRKTAETKPFSPSKLNWDGAWAAVVEKKLLTLPDFSTLPQSGYNITDGGALVVETLVDGKYRTYMYENSRHFDNPECREVEALYATFQREFMGREIAVSKARKFLNFAEVNGVGLTLHTLKYPIAVHDLLKALPVDLLARNLIESSPTVSRQGWTEYPLTSRIDPEGYYSLMVYGMSETRAAGVSGNVVAHAELILRRWQQTFVFQPEDFPRERTGVPPALSPAK